MQKGAGLSRTEATAAKLAEVLLGLSVGERLPRLHDLAHRFGCSNGTLQDAITSLFESRMVELESRGRLGTFVVSMDTSRLWEAAGYGFITMAMPMPYSKRYEGLATGLHYSFVEHAIPLTLVFVRGASHRIRMVTQGRADYCLLSGLAATTSDRLASVWDYGPHTYVGSHALLLRPGCIQSDPDLRIAIDPASFDQQEMTRRQFGTLSGLNVVMASYHQLGRLFEDGIIDATVWNIDELHDSIRGDVQVVPLQRDADERNTRAVVVRSAAGDFAPRSVADAISSKAVLRVAEEVVRGERVPSY